MNIHFGILLCIAIVLCVPAHATLINDDESGGHGRARGVTGPGQSNGINLNGPILNGGGYNGLTLNGGGYNGLQLNGGGYNGLTLNGGGWSLNGPTFNGIEPNGVYNGGGYNGGGYNGGGYNGIEINGMNFNGLSRNGLTLNGFFLNGNGTHNAEWDQFVKTLTFSGVVLDERIASTLTMVNFTTGSFLLQGASITSPSKFKGAILSTGDFISQVWAEGSSLKAQVNGTYITGKQWQGSLLFFSIVLYANQTHVVEYLYAVYVHEVIADATFPDLLSWNLTDANGTPFCSKGLATIIPGAFWDTKTGAKIQDNGLFTIACAGGALYKCSALLKYRPYAMHGNPAVSLSNHHQSCVRMIRADYCGSGVSHTVEGKLIDIWDALNPPINTQENSTWTIEAYWRPTGAYCFNAPRIKGNFNGYCTSSKMPKCTQSTPIYNVVNSFPPY